MRSTSVSATPARKTATMSGSPLSVAALAPRAAKCSSTTPLGSFNSRSSQLSQYQCAPHTHVMCVHPPFLSVGTPHSGQNWPREQSSLLRPARQDARSCHSWALHTKIYSAPQHGVRISGKRRRKRSCNVALRSMSRTALNSPPEANSFDKPGGGKPSLLCGAVLNLLWPRSNSSSSKALTNRFSNSSGSSEPYESCQSSQPSRMVSRACAPISAGKSASTAPGAAGGSSWKRLTSPQHVMLSADLAHSS
mmetsp:Transcript_23761/g.71385  ORF Transcript_23761/g.71385 Transcript_23761/m.71385 type:complete len:250 (-) Transcript_23761:242-991(-)